MKLDAAQLPRHLQQGPLAAVYVISGDEPLLCLEAVDAVRTAARAAGFTEREVFHVDGAFQWQALLEAGASMSLFGDRRLLELRMADARPSDKGLALLEHLQRLPEDILLLISMPRLDGATQKTKWAKALMDNPGCRFVAIRPVEPRQFPQWIAARLQQAGLHADTEVVELIAARVEGNLLAAAQEIEKLNLSARADGSVGLTEVREAIGDSARFAVFGLVDALLQGDAARALRILQGLRGEGVEPLVVLWALSREVRLLSALGQARDGGESLDAAFARQRPPIWDKRRPVLTHALSRLSGYQWGRLLLTAQKVDAQIKGQEPGDPWLTLEQLAVAMTGRELL